MHQSFRTGSKKFFPNRTFFLFLHPLINKKEFMKYKNIIAIAVLMLVAGTTAYSGPAVKQGPVPEGVKKLYTFLGNWKGKATMAANGETQGFDYFMDMKTDADGWGILYHEKGLIPNATPYLGFGMLAFDVNDNSLHIFTVSNYGDVHDHKGNWSDDKSFTLVYNGTMEGKPMKEELSVQIIDANTWKFTDVVSLDGQTFQTLKAEMHKIK
jgi:hypothetical protein